MTERLSRVFLLGLVGLLGMISFRLARRRTRLASGIPLSPSSTETPPRGTSPYLSFPPHPPRPVPPFPSPALRQNLQHQHYRRPASDRLPEESKD